LVIRAKWFVKYNYEEQKACEEQEKLERSEKKKESRTKHIDNIKTGFNSVLKNSQKSIKGAFSNSSKKD